MSHATAVVEHAASPAYRLTADALTGSYYLYTGINDRDVQAISIERLVSCAGIPGQKALVVLDLVDDGGTAGIEILSPRKILQTEVEDNTDCAIEVMVGTDDGTELVTIENGIAFDHSDSGYFPGIEVDYNRDGEMVAIRVEQTEVIGRLL